MLENVYVEVRIMAQEAHFAKSLRNGPKIDVASL